MRRQHVLQRPRKKCTVKICFKNNSTKQQYEQQNNCTFPYNGLCGNKPVNKAEQCCGKDVKTGNAKIKDRQITRISSDFEWKTYQSECPEMRQSEGIPDELWQQCVVGQRQNLIKDDWPILSVKKNAANPETRSYCIDGCSTPPSVVKSLYNIGIFIVPDKDNPSGFPGATFLQACSAHDICYQTCNRAYDKNTCDNNLLAESLNSCEIIPRNHVSIDSFGDKRRTYIACKNSANKMNSGLRIGGKNSFLIRKQQYCQCC